MNGLIALVVIVMVGGFVATMAIGRSKSNQEENAGYFQNTGTKWFRLGGIYAACIVLVVVFVIFLFR